MPLLATAVAVPLFPPKQVTLVWLVNTAISCVGCEIRIDVTFVQPLASVVVTVYVPAIRPLTSWVVAPVDQA